MHLLLQTSTYLVFSGSGVTEDEKNGADRNSAIPNAILTSRN